MLAVFLREPLAGSFCPLDPSTTFDHPAAWPVERLLAQCEVTRKRGSGPGGQHRNKVETAVVVEHTPSGIRGEASERRSQEENRKVALFRLRLKLAVDWPLEETTGPLEQTSPLWTSRTRGGKISVNSEHPDFPALLAEAFCWLRQSDWDAAGTAPQLGCSTSQLVKFLKQYPPAFARLNVERASLGHSPLK